MDHKIEHFKDLDTALLKEHDTIEITKSFYDDSDSCIYDVVNTHEINHRGARMKKWIYKKLLSRAARKYDKHQKASVAWQRAMRRCEFELDKLNN